MAKVFFSLIVKKYSLKPVKYQITIQSFLIGFVCLLSILPVAINGTIVELSLKQALVFASMLSVGIGCVNAFVELQSHETKLVYSTHYQFGDDYFSQLLIPNWKVRLTGFIASSIVLSLLSTLIFSIVNAVILFVFLDSTLKNFLELTLFLDVTVRVMIFAIVLTLLALLFVIVTKKSMTALIADVLLLVITLSGILRGISSKIENLLPLIGAKSFAFGRIEGTQTSQLYGFTLLVVEGILFLVFIMVVEMIRMRRKNGKNII